MKETLKMSIKEAERLGTMRQIDRKKLTLARASEEMGLCLRQTKRVRKRYLEQGEIIHGDEEKRNPCRVCAEPSQRGCSSRRRLRAMPAKW